MADIENKVDKSPVQTIDLAAYYPDGEIAEIDLKNWLFKELILKEQDFRQQVKDFNWSTYKDKNVALFCSTDAIIPVWARMLMQSALQPYARNVVYGNKEAALYVLFRDKLHRELNPEQFAGKPVVIKGCGDHPIPAGAFAEATKLLMPHARSIMYGEPCSTVPVYKKNIQRRRSSTKQDA